MISVIIPVLNEEKQLAKTISCIRKQKEDHEIIVVDGGSKDGTLKIAKKLADKTLVSSKTGRSAQMNYGATKARGKILFFIHADVQVHKNTLEEIITVLKNKKIAAGGFRQYFISKKIKKPLMNNSILQFLFRTLFFYGFKVILGDQGIFIRKKTFQKVRGFPAVEVMEEFGLCKEVRKNGALFLSKNPMYISYRRYEQGFLKTNWMYFIIVLLFYLGIDSKKIKKIYQNIR